MKHNENPSLFQSKKFQVRERQVPARGGGTRPRHYIHSQDAVVVVPELDADTLVLIRNRRFSVGQELLEFPAGTLEPGEDPAECALRELEEEAGYRARALVKLGDFYTSPGLLTEKMFVFLARDLEEVGQKLEETEHIEIEKCSRAELLALVQKGQLRDGKSLAAFFLLQNQAQPE